VSLKFRLMSGLHRSIYRASRGRLLGRVGTLGVLLLTTTGRTSGKPRTVPLLYTAAGDGYAVIASMGGAPDDPAWCKNLRANPNAVVEIGGDRTPVSAREAEGDERERLWRAMADEFGGYDGYQRRTSRRIPVVILEPIGAGKRGRRMPPSPPKRNCAG
jgi:deazaflavin-dependent oxidoreductase (nitroreductase family)